MSNCVVRRTVQPLLWVDAVCLYARSKSISLSLTVFTPLQCKSAPVVQPSDRVAETPVAQSARTRHLSIRVRMNRLERWHLILFQNTFTPLSHAILTPLLTKKLTHTQTVSLPASDQPQPAALAAVAAYRCLSKHSPQIPFRLFDQYLALLSCCSVPLPSRNTPCSGAYLDKRVQSPSEVSE